MTEQDSAQETVPVTMPDGTVVAIPTRPTPDQIVQIAALHRHFESNPQTATPIQTDIGLHPDTLQNDLVTNAYNRAAAEQFKGGALGLGQAEETPTSATAPTIANLPDNAARRSAWETAAQTPEQFPDATKLEPVSSLSGFEKGAAAAVVNAATAARYVAAGTISVPVIAYDFAKTLYTGQPDSTHVDALANYAKSNPETQKWLAPNDTEAKDPLYQLANSIGGLLPMLPVMGGAGAVEAGSITVAKATDVFGNVINILRQAAATMSPMALSGAVNKAEKLTKDGVDPLTAVNSSVADALATSAMGIVPMGAEGGFLKAGAVGATSMLATGTVNPAVNNLTTSSYPAERQPLVDTNSLISSGATGFLMGAFLGRQPKSATIQAETVKRDTVSKITAPETSLVDALIAAKKGLDEHSNLVNTSVAEQNANNAKSVEDRINEILNPKEAPNVATDTNSISGNSFENDRTGDIYGGTSNDAGVYPVRGEPERDTGARLADTPTERIQSGLAKENNESLAERNAGLQNQEGMGTDAGIPVKRGQELREGGENPALVVDALKDQYGVSSEQDRAIQQYRLRTDAEKNAHLDEYIKAEIEKSNQISALHKIKDINTGTLLNVGLKTEEVAGKGSPDITEDRVRSALKRIGVDVLDGNIHQSDSKPTFAARLSRPLTQSEAHKLSIELKQEAVAQMHNGVGELYGPKADNLKPFNPDYFLTPEGKHPNEQAQEQVNQEQSLIQKSVSKKATDTSGQTSSPEFKNWFGDSKVVDESGTPQIVYHDTDKSFTKFNLKKSAQGILWFTNDKSAIDAGEVGAAGRGKTMELYASLKNPAGRAEYDKFGLDELHARGYDGAILPQKDGKFVGFVFEPTQLKYAHRNSGEFNSENASILKSSTEEPAAKNQMSEDDAVSSLPFWMQKAAEQMITRAHQGKRGGLVVGTEAENLQSVATYMAMKNHTLAKDELAKISDHVENSTTSGFYSKETGTLFLNSDKVSKEKVPGVILHEVTHAADNPKLNAEVMRRLSISTIEHPKAGVQKSITPEQAMETNVKTKLPESEEFKNAVLNTKGAQITPDGLLIDTVRFQKQEQEGAQSVRTGVFYLPKGDVNIKNYKTGKTGYGGTEKFEEQTLLRAPIFVKGATGGKAPEAAYDSIKGKGSYQAMRKDVFDAIIFGLSHLQKIEKIKSVMEKYGADKSLASEIAYQSRTGNTLPYAIQENIVAHAVRAAGYDSVVGYSSKRSGEKFISEIFDVRETTYPQRFGESDVHPYFTGSVVQKSVNKLGFYSQLVRAIDSAPDKVFGNSASTKAWLTANAGKLGVKADELYWSGINDYLNAQKKVSKSDVQAFLKDGGVQVKEVTLGNHTEGLPLFSKSAEATGDIYSRVRARMEAAGERGNSKEATNYLVEEAMNMGRTAGHSRLDTGFWAWAQKSLPEFVVNTLKDWTSAVRAAMFRNGIWLKEKDLNIEDFVAIAKANMRDLASGKMEAVGGKEEKYYNTKSHDDALNYVAQHGGWLDQTSSGWRVEKIDLANQYSKSTEEAMAETPKKPAPKGKFGEQADLMFSRKEGSGITNETPESIDSHLRTSEGGITDKLIARGDKGKRGGLVIGKDLEDVQALFKEKTGREIWDYVLQSIAWHGSPHLFDAFKNEAIGTGEGAQAYGHGLYLAENPKVAQSYADNLGGVTNTLTGNKVQGPMLQGGANPPMSQYALDEVRKSNGDVGKAIANVQDTLKSIKPSEKVPYKLWNGILNELNTIPQDAVEMNRYMYKTDIPDAHIQKFLDWDKPLSEQSQHVQDALKNSGYWPNGENYSYGGKSPENVMGSDVARHNDPAWNEDRSFQLQKAGIPGIKYLDGSSRTAGEGTRNFVMFNPEDIRITERNGVATGQQPWSHDEKSGMDIKYSKDGKVQGFYDPKSGLTFMVANHLTKETAAPVALHEYSHATFDEKMLSRGADLVAMRDSPLIPKATREFLQQVSGKVPNGMEHEESAPYIIEHALIKGRKDGFSAIDGKFMDYLDKTIGKRIGDFIRDWVAKVRAELIKRGVGLKATVDDMIQMARAGMKQAENGEVNKEDKYYNTKSHDDALNYVAQHGGLIDQTSTGWRVGKVDLNSQYSKSTEKETGNKEVKKSISLGVKIIESSRNFTRDILDSNAVREIKMGTIPMSAGSKDAQAGTQKFINNLRAADFQFHSLDQHIEETFTKAEREAMWNAGDEQNVLMQQGLPTKGLGIDKLPPKQRALVESLHGIAQEQWRRAVSVGMATGEGMPYWTGRMATVIGESGEFERPVSKGEGARSTNKGEGGNITTSASSLKQRKYLTAAETELAMKGALGEGAQLVRDIRTMPLAMARLEKAIAGRELVNQLREQGLVTGKQLLSESKAEGFTEINHPAFTTFKPHMITNEEGKFVPALDQNGKMIMDKIPLHIANEWAGPLKAIMSTKDGIVYSAYMLLKSKAMSAILISPMTHGLVIAGRALAYSPAAVLSARAYLSGNVLLHDHALTLRAVKAGVVPMWANKGTMIDITDIASGIGKKGGLFDIQESWISHGAEAVGNVFKKGLGTSIKDRMDKFGDFYHHTLLWKQVGALQIYIFNDYSNHLVAKGMDRKAADGIAANLANRYGGAVGRENMSELARKVMNVMLFSRSFNVGNVGQVKDAFFGMPAGLTAKLYADVGKEAGDKAMRAARGKARMALVADLGMSMILTTTASSVIAYLALNQTPEDIKNGYIERLKSMLGNIEDHPFTPTSYNPYQILPTSENEPGKEERIDIGADDSGRHEYMRLPSGKVVEDIVGWMLHAPDTFVKKMAPMPEATWQAITNDKGYGVPVEDPEGSLVKHIGQGLEHVIKAQVPYDTLQTLYDVTSGHGTALDKHKLAGFVTGFSTGSGNVHGPKAAVISEAEGKLKLRKAYIMESVKRDIKHGNEDSAIERMEIIGMTQKEINNTINYIQSPKEGVSISQLKKFMQHATEEEIKKMEQVTNK